MSAAVFILACALFVPAAGSPGLDAVLNSAPAAGARVVVNADCAGADSVRLFYSLDRQSSWSQIPMTLVGSPGYESTFARAFDLPGSGTVWYYVRASDGVRLATQSPLNQTDAWPPGDNLLALAANDSVGDARNPEGPHLDLTGLWAGRSADYLYTKLTNNHTSWPLSGGTIGPWFLYSVGFANPEAASDTWVFSLSYANVPVAFSTGLYLINRHSGNYSRLADIEAVTSGNRLYMRCRRADILAHPRFAPWPNSSGAMVVAANTQTIRISGATPHDTTVAAGFYPLRTPSFVVGVNRAPVLGESRVVPRTGTTETVFRFSCSYTDPDSNLPVRFGLIADEDTCGLRPMHHRYWAGSQFACERSGFESGWRKFRFYFDDGMTAVESGTDSFFVSGVGVADRSNGPADGFAATPNPARQAFLLELSAGRTQARLFDCRGREYGQVRAGTNDVRFLPGGVYFIEASGGGSPLRLVVLR